MKAPCYETPKWQLHKKRTNIDNGAYGTEKLLLAQVNEDFA